MGMLIPVLVPDGLTAACFVWPLQVLNEMMKMKRLPDQQERTEA
jgi:hypothetical protein